MAPEVLSSRVVPASDIWSAAVMAHQLLVRLQQSVPDCMLLCSCSQRAACHVLWRIIDRYFKNSVGVQTGRFPFDDKRSPFKPSITKIWYAGIFVSFY